MGILSVVQSNREFYHTCRIKVSLSHSFSFCALEGHRLSLGFSKKESESNDILIQFVEFSNVENSDRISNVTQSNMYKYRCGNNGVS